MAGVGAWTPAANGDLWANVFRIPTNPANTSILWWGDRLLALCEGGLPFRLDPGTLESLGEELFTDIPVSQSGVSFFSAHPKRDPSGEIFNIGLKLGVPPGLEVFRCSAGGQLLQRACVPTEGFSFVHDFAITEKYVVLILPPWSCSSAGVVQSLWDGPMARKFAWREELGTRCMLLRRDDLSVVFDEVLRPAVSLYHTVNAFDDGDVVRLQIAAHNGSREAVEKNFRDMYRAIWTPETSCSLKEVVLDVASGGIKIGPAGPKDAAPFELPNVHPDVVGRRHRHIFTNASSTAVGFSNTVERLDLEGQVVDQASFAEDQFAGEPLLLPKKGATPGDELDAYVCTCVYDVSAHKSFYAFLDADDLAAGAKAEVHLPTHVPYSFHGEWVPGRVDLLAAAKSKR
ncbi:unnamed protein product [Effrenium voratum]|nr:unnamed protein product [Effrenium voratum]